jgi:type I restriction enzyme R subunit
MCKDLLRQTPQQADSREELRKLLDCPSGGVIFTTIQKFSPTDGETDHPLLTNRKNVVVIADEAHRSQYRLNSKLNRSIGEIAYGFAKYLRDALPNASFIGFTGTPVEKDDINTRSVFGDYIDVYDISRAVEDGATVPIYYESRVARIGIDEDEKPKIDAEIAEITEDEAQTEQERLKRKWASVEALVGADKRLAMIAEDLIRHFEARSAALAGAQPFVADLRWNRRSCRSCFLMITSTSMSMPVPGAQTKAPRKPGRSQNSSASASGSDLGRLDLQELAGTCDRDRPRLHRLRNLAHEVDV